jgi:hypothetical protein
MIPGPSLQSGLDSARTFGAQEQVPWPIHQQQTLRHTYISNSKLAASEIPIFGTFEIFCEIGFR